MDLSAMIMDLSAIFSLFYGPECNDYGPECKSKHSKPLQSIDNERIVKIEKNGRVLKIL